MANDAQKIFDNIERTVNRRMNIAILAAFVSSVVFMGLLYHNTYNDNFIFRMTYGKEHLSTPSYTLFTGDMDRFGDERVTVKDMSVKNGAVSASVTVHNIYSKDIKIAPRDIRFRTYMGADSRDILSESFDTVIVPKGQTVTFDVHSENIADEDYTAAELFVKYGSHNERMSFIVTKEQ